MSKNKVEEILGANKVHYRNAKMSGSEPELSLKKGKKQETVPTEMITDEMRETGVDETTPLVSREEMVAELGEEEVARIEAEAEPVVNVVKKGKK